MLILGLNMFHGDASAAVVQDGEVVFAIAEERLNRVKHYAGVPVLSIQACLDAVGANLSDVDHVAIGRDKDANLAKKVRYALANPAKILNFIQIRKRREAMNDLKTLLAGALEQDPLRMRFQEHNVEHHIAHISSAFYCSPWGEAAGFSYDGSGDFVSAMFARCTGTDVEPLERVFLPHSLGSFYTMLCGFIGYRKYGDEGKVMGLAAYGDDAYYEQIREIVSPAGSTFKLDLDYFMPLGSNSGMQIGRDGTVRMARHHSNRMIELFGEPREPHSEITRRDKDIAYAMQRRFEEVFLHLINELHKRVPSENLAMAGGCSLNSVANGKIFTETPFRRTWIQPAAGDEGLAVGAALYAYHSVLKQPRKYEMKNAFLGPEFSESRIRSALESVDLEYRSLEREPLLEEVADRIAAGNVVGWFQGRMEWGPRALGNRSILAHPGLPNMKDILNARIKHREWFRPFAPSILAEYQSDYFAHDHFSPFMLHVYEIRPDKRERLCAVNHIDNTGRLQSIAREENPLYYDLIKSFHKRTGLPVLLNTSFNENEPIVCTPEEAIDCFRRTKMDALAIGSCLVLKKDNVNKVEQAQAQ
jgi:carbamoyltransferase